MPRPTPQTFARRLGLQAIMWGLFLAAMLGAWQFSRSRDRGVQLPPMAPAKRFGDLLIAVPTGWKVSVDPSTAALLAVEPPGGPLRRAMIVTQQQLDGPPTDAFIADQLHDAEHITRIAFQGLSAKGQLAQVQLEDERTGAVLQEYDAFVFLPDENLAVTVEFRGMPGFGPIDQQNLQTIIDHLQLAPGASAGQTLHQAPGPLVPI